jgi:hypothetical protein
MPAIHLVVADSESDRRGDLSSSGDKGASVDNRNSREAT